MVRIDGVDRPMPPHGFAAAAPFAVVEREYDRCTLVLTDDAHSRSAYPFRFRLQLDYLLEADAIVCAATVTNTGDVPMPASFGYHPGFRWPLPGAVGKEGHELVFPDDNHLDCRVLRDGALGPDVERVPLDDHRLALSENLFASSAQIVLAYRSRSVRYRARGGGPEIDVTRENLPQLGLWMRPGGDYLCIEPWHGYTVPVGFVDELRDRPGGFVLAPGEAQSFALTIGVHDSAPGA
jgi:galactose mutarotase-like enzyme